MTYLFVGRLCGYLCPECPEPLANVKVRLYRPHEAQQVTALAVADPKDTLNILNESAAEEKQSRLLAEVETDEMGNFRFELDEKNYDGGVFEVDIYCDKVPHQANNPKRPSQPRQFTLTTLQPMWRQNEIGYMWRWEYCLPARFWCAFRALFDAWTICGKVVNCETKAPIAGVKVSAFDADWITDDLLGSAITDGNGRFRIDYTSADFKVTFLSPIINVETPFPPFNSGPDLYFHVETFDSSVALLTENRPRGQQPDRANVGHCFCVELCVDTDGGPPTKYPWFTHVGDFHIYTDIDAVDGKTQGAVAGHSGSDYGFFDGPQGRGLKLKGFCPKTHPIGGEHMRYRFLYEHPANPGTLVPITGAMLYPVVVGSRAILWDLFGTGPAWTFQTIIVAGSGATMDPTPTPSPLPPPGTPWGPVPSHVIVPDADGWITVDQKGLDDGFYGPLLRFITATAVPGGVAPGNGAGTLPASPKNGAAIRILFEAEPVSGPTATSPTLGNDLPKILINNWSEVRELNLQQFLAPGADCCSGLSTALDILYTADHEFMKNWGVGISSCASGMGWSPTPPSLPGGTSPRGGAGTNSRNIAAWPSCSYTVTLSTIRALTDGEVDDTGKNTQLTFCK